MSNATNKPQVLSFIRDSVCINGTSLQGYLQATYDELVEVFGKPHYGPDADEDKITCEWQMEYEDGTVATIYDYKTRSTPFGLYQWHIGGYTKQAVHNVYQSFADNIVDKLD